MIWIEEEEKKVSVIPLLRLLLGEMEFIYRVAEILGIESNDQQLDFFFKL